MAQLVQIHDLLNDLTLWAGIYPIVLSEQSIAGSEVWRLPTDSLSILDRGYASYTLMYLLINQESPRHFCDSLP